MNGLSAGDGVNHQFLLYCFQFYKQTDKSMEMERKKEKTNS